MARNPHIPYFRTRLDSARLFLRPYRSSDFRQLCAAQTATTTLPRTSQGEMSIELKMRRKEFVDQVMGWKTNWARGVHYVFGAFERQSDVHTGRVDIFLINRQLQWANLGYQIHPQYRSRGFATEAVLSALLFGFETLGFHRIESATDPENCSAAAVALKVGMTFEGVRRDFFPQRPGSDMMVYATNALEFAVRRETASPHAKAVSGDG
jgi:ribosomal-protein-alanine N-acetyltransferase